MKRLDFIAIGLIIIWFILPFLFSDYIYAFNMDYMVLFFGILYLQYRIIQSKTKLKPNKYDFIAIGLLVFYLSLPFLFDIGTGEGFYYDLGSHLGGVIIFGLIYLGYRIWQKRTKHEEKNKDVI